MKFKFSKNINSNVLKKDLDKKLSVESARTFSTNLPKGKPLLACPFCIVRYHYLSEKEACF